MKKTSKNLLLSFFIFLFAQNMVWAQEENLGSGISLPEPNTSFFNDYSFSFFGTAGYAISDKDYAYNKISNHGTFDADSRLGAQVDWQVTPRLGVTLQGELSPSLSDDHRWRPQLTWALLKYRVTDNWELKLGRSRLPALLYTQNANVGMSYIPARLPIEVYGLSPTFVFNGISSTYTWDVGDDGMQTLSWDAYAGMANAWQRVWFRTNPNTLQSGANYYQRRMNVVGTFFTYEDAMEGNILRTGVHYVLIKNRDGSTFQKVNNVTSLLPYGIDFDVYDPTGGQRIKEVRFLLFGILADWHLGNGFYATGEIGVRRTLNMDSGLDGRAAYLQLRRRFGDFTPYISYAFSESNTKSRRLYNAMLRQTGVAALATYDMANRISADSMLMANQSTLAIGTAYDIGTNHRLKLEYARTRVRDGSYLVDQGLYDNSNGNGINVFSASYNFLF